MNPSIEVGVPLTRPISPGFNFLHEVEDEEQKQLRYSSYSQVDKLKTQLAKKKISIPSLTLS